MFTAIGSLTRFARLTIIFSLTLALLGLTPGLAQAETGTLARTLEVLPAGNKVVRESGTLRGSGMARESASIAVTAGAVVEARVTNGVRDVELQLITGRNVADGSIVLEAAGGWASVTAIADAGVFFRLKDATEWRTAPRVEYRVSSGTSYPMPEYRRDDNPATFFAAWDQSNSPFAVIIDPSVSILVPIRDKDGLRTMQGGRFSSMDETIDFYRSMLATYDDWLGLSANDPAAHHRPLAHRYFVRPDTTGWGAAYYMGGNYMGLNGTSSLPYILGNDQWLMLHEVGHGYDGFMTSSTGAGDFELGEVWNNIYSHAYETGKMGIARGWLYGNAEKVAAQAASDAYRYANGGTLEFNVIDHRRRLDAMARITDLTGMDGFRTFNRSLRDLHVAGAQPGQTRRTDLIGQHWGLPSGVNLVPWIETFGGALSFDTRSRLMDVTPATMAMPLRDLVPDASQATLTALGLTSAGELVRTAQTRQLGITTTVRVTGQGNAAAIEGRNVTLWDGNSLMGTAAFRNGIAEFQDLPVGTYTVRYPQARETGFVPASDWVLARAGAAADNAVTYPTGDDFSSVGDVDLRLLGISDGLFAQLSHDRSDGRLILADTMKANAHSYFPREDYGNGYATIRVTEPGGQVTLERTFYGDEASAGPAKTVVAAPVGTEITVTHREADRMQAVTADTGTPRGDLKFSGPSTTYVVTVNGLALKSNPNAAPPALAAELEAALDALANDIAAHPGAWFAPRAAELRSAINLLEAAERAEVLERHSAMLEAALLPVTDPIPVESPSPGPSPTPTDPTPTPDPAQPTVTEPSSTPTATAPDAPSFSPSAPYTLAGAHDINGRRWQTSCEPYSSTVRCRTEIWATVVNLKDGQFVRSNGWAFNNLTYLPYLSEGEWAGNPLAEHNMEGFTSGGRQWRTECHTPQTGRGACRSYTMTTVYSATPKATGGYGFSQNNGWVFNNIVLFES